MNAAPESVAHLAGPDITHIVEGHGSVLRQRCTWCGATLIDVNLDQLKVPDGQDSDPHKWPMFAFVEVTTIEGARVSNELEWQPGQPVPDNACLRMPLELTA